MPEKWVLVPERWVPVSERWVPVPEEWLPVLERWLPVTERLVTAALVRGRTGLTVRVVAALLVTRLGVVAT